MDIGFLTDPTVVTFVVFFGISILSAVGWHAWVRNYLIAVIAAAVLASVISYLTYRLVETGFIPTQSFFMATLPVCLAIAAGVGIPFHRRRTGKSLLEN